MKKFATLYHETKAGKIRQWTVWAKDGVIYTEHGDKDGKLQLTEKKAKAKNVGKKNETTVEAQAETEAQALWTKKRKGKYFETIEEAKELTIAPMLIKDYREDKVKFPCYAQPKLDGCRCLAYWKDDEIYMMSRGFDNWAGTMTHIKELLEEVLPKNAMLDGELYVHGMHFEDILELVKKKREESVKIEYHVYDYVEPDTMTLSFTDRLERLKNLGLTGKIIVTSTKVVETVEDLEPVKTEYLEGGYEGTIVRNANAPYLFLHRSDNVFRIKEFIDAEFKVVDIIEGEGSMEGKAICICQNDTNEHTFKATMNIPMEKQAEMFQQKDKYIGRMLTVKYFCRTDKNDVPKWAKGKAFRPKKDLQK